jgi:small subunit ribosomal protein S8
MVGDKISNLIIKLKNASKVGKTTADVALSNLNTDILKVLKAEKFISDFEANKKDHTITVTLAYDESGDSKITDVKRVSKLSKRIYRSSDAIKPVKNGLGLSIVTTPAGVMTGRQAREKKVGGEVMFEIW